MGMIQSFERRLQGAVGNTFARLFGGSVHPSEVISAIQADASAQLKHQNGRTIAPNRFTVRLGPTDRGVIGDDDQRVAAALADTIREYIDEQGWDTFGPVDVDFEESRSMHTGQFRVSSVVDPDTGRSSRSQRQPSDPGARMSQPPADPYRQPYQPAPPYQGGYQQPQQGQPGYPQQGGYQQPYYGQPAEPYYGRGGYPNDYYPGQDYAPEFPPDSIATLHADDGSGRSYQLIRGSNIIGRGQDAAFRLPDTAVSRRHVDIYFDGAIAVMHDLGSTNGTTVNGAAVRTWQLADGDVIRLGHSTIIFNQQG